ncbi:CoA pyrophosphatase [Edwardsiella hoshinae]|uniref:Putative NUDIX hydrolase n=1 Tax=Edwardsiella hoshinae TaxID=93378 RepID=A0A376DF81_9GAMM|nr:CoA pyrophosphatase [Edwardsiella hoshinae]QPR27118.1 CoA pyrophosphatase [Edwardsiella hoshinae]STC88415.1 putative NUDIX hydrolase [Edwardsiella hoshinae]
MHLSPELTRFVTRFQLQPPLPGRGTRHARQAAVLIPIINRPQPTLLLTQRALRMRQHPGQVAFPGGARDARDASPVATALREAQEEIALCPHQAAILGQLPAEDSSSGFCVTPVVALLAPTLALRPNPHEVADIFEIPLTLALDARRYHTLEITRGGQPHRLYLSHYRRFLIWGLTAAMLRRLALQVAAR